MYGWRSKCRSAFPHSLVVLGLLCGCSDSATPPAAPTPTATPTPAPTPTPTPAPAPAAPVTIAALVLNPPNIGSQSRSEATVTLTGPAPEGGAVVSLASTNRDTAKVPATMTIAAGQTFGTFFAESSTVGTPTPVSIVATYGGVSNGATLTVGPQPLRAVVQVNDGVNTFCDLQPGGNIISCRFDGSRSTGDPVLYRWYLRTSVGTHDAQTTSPLWWPETDCRLFAGHEQSAPGQIQIEVGLQVQDQRGERSEVARTTLTVRTWSNCGYRS